MNTLPKLAVAITICITILQSCIITTVAEEIDKTIMAEEEFHTFQKTKGNGYKVTLKILNNAENTILQIDTLNLCNIMLSDSVSGISCKSHLKINDKTISVPYGSHTAMSSEIIAIQELVPWEPAEGIPLGSNKSYAKIYGTMFTQNCKPDTLYSGIMYYPISGCITGHNSTEIPVNLHPNCPLYGELNGKMEKILQPIAFCITVADWE